MTRMVSLRKVAEKAMKDRKFFNGLLASPDEALEGAGFRLSPVDRRRLARALSSKKKGRSRVHLEFDLVEVLTKIHRRRPWGPPTWPHDVWERKGW